jgi:hypothetical protein
LIYYPLNNYKLISYIHLWLLKIFSYLCMYDYNLLMTWHLPLEGRVHNKEHINAILSELLTSLLNKL